MLGNSSAELELEVVQRNLASLHVGGGRGWSNPHFSSFFDDAPARSSAAGGAAGVVLAKYVDIGCCCFLEAAHGLCFAVRAIAAPRSRHFTTHRTEFISFHQRTVPYFH